MSGKLNGAIVWNLASVVILAVAGVGANVLVGRHYGPEILGVFNQVMSLYVVFSQLAAFGFHYSVLKYVAEWRDDPSLSNSIAHSGLMLAVVFGLVTCFVAYATLPFVHLVFQSEAVVEGWRLTIPTLFPFAMNKVLLALLNAHERMRLFAAFQSIRYLLILALIGLIIATGSPAVWVSVVIGAAEVALLLILLPFAFGHFRPLVQPVSRTWVRKHFSFGSRGYLTAAALELNSKVDILILGVFLTDRNVGIYSMATLFLEGLLQIGAAIRNVYNPKITRHFTGGTIGELEKLIASTRNKLRLGAAGVGVLAFAFFPIFVHWIVGDPAFLEGWYPLGILIVGFVACSAQYPFNMIFIQTGFPGTQTIYNGLAVLANLLLNLALVPFFGVYGSALGTALAFVLSVLILRRMARKTVGIAV